MSYELRSLKPGPGRWFNLHISGWPEMLALAQTYGWKPAGTTYPKAPLEGCEPDASGCRWLVYEGQPQNGGYLGNDFQHVSDADAFAMRDALQRAKDAIEAQARHQRRAQAKAKTLIDERGCYRLMAVKEPENPFDEPDDDSSRIELIRGLIDFLDKGGFDIW
jgi:hypothetical protein